MPNVINKNKSTTNIHAKIKLKYMTKKYLKIKRITDVKIKILIQDLI